jgi:hypothetical protein
MAYAVRDVLAFPQSSGIEPCDDDEKHFVALRKFVSDFIHENALKYGKDVMKSNTQSLMLDIAPQDYQGAQPFTKFSEGFIRVETLDINTLLISRN